MSLNRLASLLDIEVPTVADRNMIPLGVVLSLADLLSVDLETVKGTAEDRLRVLVEEAGLVDAHGQALTFPDKRSIVVAGPLADQVEAVLSQQRHRARRAKKPSLAADRFKERGARNKLEAVNRISALTDSGPETLGPGSKERKSVLTNLHRGLGYGEPPETTKSDLGRILAEKLDTPWDRTCHSTGETITLTGLNRLLAAATERLESDPAGTPSAQEEAMLYAAVILQEILATARIDRESCTATWDGRSAVTDMVDNNDPNARQTEWPGWYFEYRVLDRLVQRFGGGPHPVGRTTFDYRGQRTWDLKVHSDHGKGAAPLNDLSSVRRAVEEDGLGFIMLRGVPSYDGEPDFYAWHNHEIRGNAPRERSARSRKLKTGFELRRIDFYFADDAAELARLEEAGILKVFTQGRQQSGAERPVKYQMIVDRAQNNRFLAYSVDVAEHLRSIHTAS